MFLKGTLKVTHLDSRKPYSSKTDSVQFRIPRSAKMSMTGHVKLVNTRLYPRYAPLSGGTVLAGNANHETTTQENHALIGRRCTDHEQLLPTCQHDKTN